MKKNLPWPIVVVVVLVALGICGFVYSNMQVGIKFPEPGTKAEGERIHRNKTAPAKPDQTKAPDKPGADAKTDPK